MRLRVITGLGPGHERFMRYCSASVRTAMRRPGRFTSIEHTVIDDTGGQRGCAGAKNYAMSKPGADWFFFLDADDLVMPDAFELCDFDSPATFGAIRLVGGRVLSMPTPRPAKNVYPCGWREVAVHGAGGTLIMGCFVRADIATAVGFDAADELTDDFGFFLKLPSFTKVGRALIRKRVNTSAGGPRRIGHAQADWTGRCNEMIRRAVLADPARFGVADMGEVLSQVAAYR